MKLDSRLVSFFTIALITIVMACSNSKTMDEDRKENDGNKTPTPSAQLAKWEPITFEQADTIIDNYRENFRPRFEARNDTTYKRRQTDHVWTSIDSLKTFLNAIEKESVDKNKIALSGVRFYFAAYKNNGHIHRRGHEKQITLVAVGTYYDKNTRIHWDLVDTGKKKVLSLIPGLGNHGHLCPPDSPQYCSGAHFPSY